MPSRASRSAVERLPLLTEQDAQGIREDWLVSPISRKTGVFRTDKLNEIVLTNGLISRTFRISPNAATVGYDNLADGQTLLRGVKPEASVTLDGVPYDVGGLLGQPEYGYLLPEWLESMTADPDAFAFTGFDVGQTEERFGWNRKRYSADLPWPPPGASLTLRFSPPAGKCPGIEVEVHYEMYDGVPLLCKWLVIRNNSDSPVTLNTFKSEILAAVEYESLLDIPGRCPWGKAAEKLVGDDTPVISSAHWEYPNMHVESDYAFFGFIPKTASRTTFWTGDPQYKTQINFSCLMPVLLESRPPVGPDVVIPPGESLETFHTFELPHDSTDRQRKGLAIQRMYRTIAPWVTENPILMHVRQSAPDAVRLAVDQCAEVGFEMVILTFKSGVDMENEDPAYLAQMKELVDYAHSKGVELGGYSLLASRTIDADNDCINVLTGKTDGMAFAHAPCLGSQWGQDYLRKLRAFIDATGFDVLENDGSYAGDLCASTTHPGHRGPTDSQWIQWKAITDFYKWCRARGIYLNVPDWYLLSGSNKIFMGYREVNYSLPRDRQIMLSRQNLYDGTWDKTPSMGWMFVPLTEYHGGGTTATLEPLDDNLREYEAHLAQNFGYGAQALWRGNHLYDTPRVKEVVKKWVSFYHRHRELLDSAVIHIRRPDGRDYDGIVHVNPQLRKAMAVIFNPRPESLKRTITIPLYYAGLTDRAVVHREGAPDETFTLDRKFNIDVPLELPPDSVTWLLIEEA